MVVSDGNRAAIEKSLKSMTDDLEVAEPLISLVVSTVGRPFELARLLDSLAREIDCAPSFEIILVDQEPAQRSLRVLHTADANLRWTYLTSGRGVSVGRNVGLARARGEIIGFPDDNCWYTGSTLRSVYQTFEQRPEIDVVCGRQVTESGRNSMLRWAKWSRRVTRTNHHRTSIASTMFMKREVLEGIPPFDEELGTGTSTIYGACEESDLLLRALRSGARAWYERRVIIHQEDTRYTSIDSDYRAKMLRYGCGQGRLWRTHGFPRLNVAVLVVRKFVKIMLLFLRGKRRAVEAEYAWLRGVAAGLTAVPPADRVRVDLLVRQLVWGMRGDWGTKDRYSADAQSVVGSQSVRAADTTSSER